MASEPSDFIAYRNRGRGWLLDIAFLLMGGLTLFQVVERADGLGAVARDIAFYAAIMFLWAGGTGLWGWLRGEPELEMDRRGFLLRSYSRHRIGWDQVALIERDTRMDQDLFAITFYPTATLPRRRSLGLVAFWSRWLRYDTAIFPHQLDRSFDEVLTALERFFPRAIGRVR